MSTRYRRFRRRLATFEESLGRSQGTETPLYAQVELEAKQALSPEDLPLFESATAARREGRFYSLDEDAVMTRFDNLRDIAARQHGFNTYGQVLYQYFRSHPQPEPSEEQCAKMIKTLNWGRDNWAHLSKLRQAQKASLSSSSAAMITCSPSSDQASSTPLDHPIL